MPLPLPADFPLNEEQIADFRADKLDMDDDLYQRLYAYYTSPARGPDGMPYGTAKARDGDPDQWIENALYRDLGR